MIRTPTSSQLRISFPTMLTIGRIFLVPFIVKDMIDGAWGWAFGLFCLAAVTDILDGALARWWDDSTLLGACLDPIADKILVLSCFFTLAFVHGPLFTIPLWFVLLVLCKELLLLIGISLLYLIKGRVSVQPVLLGKLSMVIQSCFIIWLFACYFFHWMPVKTYFSMLGIVIAVSFASLIQYFLIGLSWLTKHNHQHTRGK